MSASSQPDPARTTETFQRIAQLPASRAAAWRWHASPGAFDRLVPPWIDIDVVERYDRLEDDARLVFDVRRGPMPMRWIGVHEDVRPGHGFVDVQEKGPFAFWRHEHRFEDDPRHAGDDERSLLVDHVEFRLPLHRVASKVAGGFLRGDLDAMFAWRHRTTIDDLAFHARHDGPPRRVAVFGAGGLVGRTLCAILSTGGHEVLRIVRGRAARRPDEVGWSERDRFLEPERLEGLDAFVDLGGEPILGGLGGWSQRQKKAIDRSRGDRVAEVVRALGDLAAPPKAFLCASAIGIYDAENGGDDKFTERLPSRRGGSSFLGGVARRWEESAARSSRWAEREVRLRFGVVLSPQGGALATMLPTFRMGAGMIPGSGRQWLSWVSACDAAGAVAHAIFDDRVDGAVHVTAPEPMPMGDFCRVLADVLDTSVRGKVPAAALRLALGSMAKETVLSSVAALPGKLSDTGYVFRQADAEDALRHLLGRVAGISERGAERRSTGSELGAEA